MSERVYGGGRPASLSIKKVKVLLYHESGIPDRTLAIARARGPRRWARGTRPYKRTHYSPALSTHTATLERTRYVKISRLLCVHSFEFCMPSRCQARRSSTLCTDPRSDHGCPLRGQAQPDALAAAEHAAAPKTASAAPRSPRTLVRSRRSANNTGTDQTGPSEASALQTPRLRPKSA